MGPLPLRSSGSVGGGRHRGQQSTRTEIQNSRMASERDSIQLGFEDRIGIWQFNRQSWRKHLRLKEQLSRGLRRSKENSIQEVHDDRGMMQCRKSLESHIKETRHWMKVQGHRDGLKWVRVARLDSGGEKRTRKLGCEMHWESKTRETTQEDTTTSHRNVSGHSEIHGGAIISFKLRATGDRPLEHLLLRKKSWVLCLGLLGKSSPDHFRHATSHNNKTERKHSSVTAPKQIT